MEKLHYDKIKQVVQHWFDENIDYSKINEEEKQMITLSIGKSYGIWCFSYYIPGEVRGEGKLLASGYFDHETCEFIGQFGDKYIDIPEMEKRQHEEERGIFKKYL